ncbi:hypothetical protein V499_07450 [Pseudogymnoascus sp. VKM F-103]|nr:hypothetical protein V499_07450 [Pseudogymnoascus sp. VKM F-103]
MSIYVVAIITPAPGKEELVKSLLADFANTVKTNEPNAVRYLVLEQYDGHEGELCKLVVQETYHTQEAFDEHFKTEHFAALGKLIGEDKLEARCAAEKARDRNLSAPSVLAQGDDIFAIPGTTKIHRLAENLGSMSISLSSEEEKAVRELAKGVMGGRVQKLMGHTFADTPQLEKVWGCTLRFCRSNPTLPFHP